MAADSRIIEPGDPPRTGLDYHYERHIVARAKAINGGLVECYVDDNDSPEITYCACKCKSPVLWTGACKSATNGIGCRFRHWIHYVAASMPVAEITGSKDLLPFMLDVVQLGEMQRIRMMPKDQHYGEQTFWGNMTWLVSDRYSSAKENQHLRSTMPIECQGPVRYDLVTLGQNMLDRFTFCRTTLGMNDLPNYGRGA